MAYSNLIFCPLLKPICFVGSAAKKNTAIDVLVVTFVGNIISLTRTLRDWQETIMDKVLEQLQTFIDPLKPQLLDVLEAIMEKCALQEGSPFTGISSEKLAFVRKKLGDLYCSIEVDGVTAVQGAHWHQVAPNTSKLLKDVKARRTEAIRLRNSGISPPSVAFRKPSEPEIVALLNSVWSSIR